MPLELVQTIDAHLESVLTLAWDPTGTYLASTGTDQVIHIWSKQQDKWICSSSMKETHGKSIRKICWSPCGNFLASASFDATVNIWKRDFSKGSWSNVVSLEGHENEVKSVDWSHDGRFLASCGRDRTVWIWERSELDDDDELNQADSAESWDCSDVKNDHSQDVKHVVWHPNFNILVSCSYDGSIKIFHMKDTDWICYETLTGHSSTVWSADFSGSGEFLVTCGDDKSVKIWKNHAHDKLPLVESNSWKCVSTIQGYHSRYIYDVSWCKLCDIIVSASGDNSLVFYERSNDPSDEGNFIGIERFAEAHICDVNTVVWNPKDKGLLASGCDNGTVKLWTYKKQNEGMKLLPIADKIIESLTDRFSSIRSSKANNSDLDLQVTDHSNLLYLVQNVQLLQDSINEDREIVLLEELFNVRIIDQNLPHLAITDLMIDGNTRLVQKFSIIITDPKGEIRFKIHVNPKSPKFNLSLPKRTSKLFAFSNELFLVEKTGDIYKVFPSGECKFLLGHLFSLTDVKLVCNGETRDPAYIISADRDEKIRISNYPDTHKIERFCFGHKHFVRKIITVNHRQFISIDQENYVYLWDLSGLDSLNNQEELKPLKTLSLLDGPNKRARVR